MWGLLVPCQAWHNFGRALAKGVLERAGLQENIGAGHMVLARFVPVCLEEGCGSRGLAGGGTSAVECGCGVRC